jgi:DNA polymerase-4
MDHCPIIWPRAILHIDMDAFFAAIEQRDFPALRGKPVAVTNGERGTCIITSSYEARAHGIRTGMRLQEARLKCPALIQRPSRPTVYARVSTQIMRALEAISPDIEIFSVDEAFLDVTRCQRLHGTPARMALMAKRLVREIAGIHCSVGVSGDKSTAKFASNLRKPDGLTIIPPWESKARLADAPITELCGVGPGIGGYLAARGVRRCGDMARLPIGELGQRFGNVGRRIWLMCQGLDPDPVHTAVAAPRSLGHGKVLPPDTRDRDTLATYLSHMSEKVGARLRRHDMRAQVFAIGLRTREAWIGGKFRLTSPGNDGREIFALCRQLLSRHWRGEGIFQIQVTALDPVAGDGQAEIFAERKETRTQVNAVMDRINEKYGELTLAPSRLLNRPDTPNVISPAWKPDGHRQTV